MKMIILLFGLAILASVATPNAQAQAPGPATFTVGVASRHVLPPGQYDWRGAGGHALTEAVWYPADSAAPAKPQLIPPVGTAIFQAAPAAPDAPIAASPKKFPLILLSHGTGGTVQSLAWFATALASRGYIVVGVNHPGNNAMAPYTVQGFMLWWLRAQDLRAALDDILADDRFGPRIDRRRIGAAGFSLGGYTVLELAGARTSLAGFTAYCEKSSDPTTCQSPPEFPDLISKYQMLAKSDRSFAAALRAMVAPTATVA